MEIIYSERFLDALEFAPAAIQRAFYKQLGYLKHNLRHPSLRAKKFDETHDIWQARVNRDWRFYFTVEGDRYRLIEITAHPK
jgi:plasmid maintenance system killer protein